MKFALRIRGCIGSASLLTVFLLLLHVSSAQVLSRKYSRIPALLREGRLKRNVPAETVPTEEDEESVPKEEDLVTITTEAPKEDPGSGLEKDTDSPQKIVHTREWLKNTRPGPGVQFRAAMPVPIEDEKPDLRRRRSSGDGGDEGLSELGKHGKERGMGALEINETAVELGAGAYGPGVGVAGDQVMDTPRRQKHGNGFGENGEVNSIKFGAELSKDDREKDDQDVMLVGQKDIITLAPFVTMPSKTAPENVLESDTSMHNVVDKTRPGRRVGVGKAKVSNGESIREEYDTTNSKGERLVKKVMEKPVELQANVSETIQPVVPRALASDVARKNPAATDVKHDLGTLKDEMEQMIKEAENEFNTVDKKGTKESLSGTKDEEAKTGTEKALKMDMSESKEAVPKPTSNAPETKVDLISNGSDSTTGVYRNREIANNSNNSDLAGEAAEIQNHIRVKRRFRGRYRGGGGRRYHYRGYRRRGKRAVDDQHGVDVVRSESSSHLSGTGANENSVFLSKSRGVRDLHGMKHQQTTEALNAKIANTGQGDGFVPTTGTDLKRVKRRFRGGYRGRGGGRRSYYRSYRRRGRRDVAGEDLNEEKESDDGGTETMGITEKDSEAGGVHGRVKRRFRGRYRGGGGRRYYYRRRGRRSVGHEDIDSGKTNRLILGRSQSRKTDLMSEKNILKRAKRDRRRRRRRKHRQRRRAIGVAGNARMSAGDKDGLSERASMTNTPQEVFVVREGRIATPRRLKRRRRRSTNIQSSSKKAGFGGNQDNTQNKNQERFPSTLINGQKLLLRPSRDVDETTRESLTSDKAMFDDDDDDDDEGDEEGDDEDEADAEENEDEEEDIENGSTLAKIDDAESSKLRSMQKKLDSLSSSAGKDATAQEIHEQTKMANKLKLVQEHQAKKDSPTGGGSVETSASDVIKLGAPAATADPVLTWGEWSACSVTCGLGQRYRVSICGQPGEPCEGRDASEESQVCSGGRDC